MAPGFGEVEGYDPTEWDARWRQMQKIDDDKSLTGAEKRDAKMAVGSGIPYGDWKREHDEIKHFARESMEIAASQEPKVSKMLKSLEDDSRKLAGYAFRLKSIENLKVKEENHVLYEERRKLKDNSPQANKLDSKMIENANKVATPPNIESVRL